MTTYAPPLAAVINLIGLGFGIIGCIVGIIISLRKKNVKK